MRGLQPLRGRLPVEDCITMVELKDGELDKRTGLKVGGERTWMEHPNNPMAKTPRKAKYEVV